MNALEIVKNAAGAAVAADRTNRVLGWNPAAEELFALRERPIVGQNLLHAIAARDVYGNRLGSRHLAVAEMTRRGEPVGEFQLEARRTNGEVLRLAASVVVVVQQRSADCDLVYLFRQIGRRRRADEAVERLLASPQAVYLKKLNGNGRHNGGNGADLTPRQLEVLRLMAGGSCATEIAETLCVSKATVRSHIQCILNKLGAHTQAEAVARALNH